MTKKIRRYVEIVHNAHKKDWDTVVCIAGKNRFGKTNLGMEMVEHWLDLQGIDINDEAVDNHIGISKVSFAKVLDIQQKMGVVMDDEAGDISSRSAMSKANKLYMTAYQVIAAENLFTILILPEFWNLDSYFRKDRVKHLFYVYKRGRVALYDMHRMEKLVAINENLKVKNYWVVNPILNTRFNIYKGGLKKRYDEMKKKKLKQVRTELRQEIEEDSKMSGKKSNSQMEIRNAAIRKMVKDGLTDKAIAEDLFLHIDTIKKYRRQMRMQKIAGEGE